MEGILVFSLKHRRENKLRTEKKGISRLYENSVRCQESGNEVRMI